MKRVWYEPSPGLRFAGIDLGEGSRPQWRRVLLSGHYWQWKSSKGQHHPFENGEQCAIVPDSLFPRGSTVLHLDAETPEAQPEDPPASTIIDLFEALKESVDGGAS